MKRCTYALLLLLAGQCLLPGIVVAQLATPAPTRSAKWGGLGFFEIGYVRNNAGAALSGLPAGESARSAQNGLWTGGCGYGIMRNVVIGGMGGAIRQATNRGSRYHLRLAGEGGQVQIGYAARVGPVLLLPLAGFGGTDYTLRVQDRQQLPATFGGVLTGQLPEITLKHETPVGSLSLMALGRWQGLAVGLRVLYQTALRAAPWRYDGQELAGSPRWRPRQFSVTLLLGGGWISSQ